MKNSIIFFFVLALLICTMSCDKEDVWDEPGTALQADELLKQEAAHNKAVLKNTANLYDFTTAEVIPQAFSKLIRRDDGISAVIHTSGLEAKGVYTVWMAVFENPEFCSDNSCELNDIFDSNGNILMNPDGTFGTPGVNVSLLWVDGKVVSAAGIGTFNFKVKENSPPGEVLFGPGLTDTQGSEIHFALRNHGPAIPGQLEAQLTTFSGGCEVNQCMEEQFTIHLAEY
jgi:hypothetical protein